MKDLKPGDILGFSGDSWLSASINIMTYGIPWWSLSHVGIIGEHPQHGLLLYESTTLDDSPCVIQGKPFRGTQAQRLDTRIQNYEGKVWHYPLYRELYTFERERLNLFLNSTIGIPYDQIGAFRAGGIGFSLLESLAFESDLHSIFCSEWCAAAHAQIGIFSTDNPSRWNPNRFVRAERWEGKLLRPERMK
jgi:hypothetical protein